MLNIDHILKLARLELEAKEKKEIEKEFSSILAFVEKLQKAETKGVKPMSHTINLENVTKEDKVKVKIKNEKVKAEERLIEMAPEKKDKYIKTKQIL